MSEKSKVLVICQHFWPEAFRINDICDFFVEKGCEIEVLCGIPNYPQGQFYPGYSYFKNRKQEHNGVKIRRVFEVPRGNNTNLRIFLNYISFPIASLFHVPRLLFKKYDHIFLYQLSPVMMTIAGIIVGKVRRTETTLYVLDLWPENLFSVLNVQQPFLRKLITRISHWHYRHVDKIIVMSEAMKKKIIEITRIPEDRITTIPQTSEKLYETLIPDDNLTERFGKGFNIVYAGNISPAQSFETIIAAAESLQKEGITDINWIIVGDGMSKKAVEKAVSIAGLSDIFYFEGHKPMTEIPKYNYIADILVACLSKSELLEATIPAKITSYIASGKPVVLAMDGEIQELVNNAIVCGLVGPAEDASILAKNILTIHELTSNERENMGQRGRDYYFKQFERSIVLAKLYDFIFSAGRL